MEDFHLWSSLTASGSRGRRPRSAWSKRNVETIGRLANDGRLRERGIAEVDRAKADGRWDSAYAGPASAEVPDELAEALRANPEAHAVFAALNRTDRFVAMAPILSAPDPALRARRAASRAARLARRAQQREDD